MKRDKKQTRCWHRSMLRILFSDERSTSYSEQTMHAMSMRHLKYYGAHK